MKAASIQKEIIDNYFNQLQHYGYTNINKSQQVLFAVLLLDAFDLFSDMLDVQFEKDVRRIMRKLECCMCELPLGLVDGSVEGESYTQGWWELVSPTYGAEMVLALQKEIDKKVDRDELAQVAFTGNYEDLEDKPEINNGKLTIIQDGTTVAEFTANSKVDVVAELSSGSALVTKITHNTTIDTYSADHTIRELIEAYEAGKTVVAQLGSDVYALVGYYPYDNIQFYKADSTERGSLIQMYDDGGQDVVEVTAQTSPSARITFTQGGVTKGSFTVNQRVNATIALDAGSGIQSDWTQTDSEAPDFIKHKPILEATASYTYSSGSYTYTIFGLDDVTNPGIYQLILNGTVGTFTEKYKISCLLEVTKISDTQFVQTITSTDYWLPSMLPGVDYVTGILNRDYISGSWSGWRVTQRVGNGVLTITQDGVSKGTFSANQAGNQTIALVSGITYIDHTGD